MKKIYLIATLLLATCFLNAQVAGSEKVYRSTDVERKPDLPAGMYTLTVFMRDNFRFPPIQNKKITIFTRFIV